MEEKQNDKHKEYKVRHIRMDDPVWDELKEKRRKSKLSWNRFIKQLMHKKHERDI